jgi:hypothetical protein
MISKGKTVPIRLNQCPLSRERDIVSRVACVLHLQAPQSMVVEREFILSGKNFFLSDIEQLLREKKPFILH